MKKEKALENIETPLIKLKRLNKSLLSELDVARETIYAIQHGEVDALIISGKKGDEVHTLLKADQPYRVLVENMNEGAVTLTTDGTIFYCNRRFSEYVTIPIDLLIGTSIFLFVKPEELDRFKEIFSLGRISKSYTDDFYFDLSAGKSIPLRITMSSTFIEERQGVCMIATDLTQQIRQIEYEKLTIELKAAVQARDEFISLASHELKTPLTSLLLLSQMQMKMIGNKNPLAFSEKRVTNLAEKTESLSSKLHSLVEAMLDITKIQTGEICITKEKMDLGKLTKAVLVRMRSMFLAEGCQPPKFKQVEMLGNWDSNRLEQVLNNLLVNAIKYGNHSEMEVTIEEHKGKARLSVRDKGKGILKIDQLKIFTRYERAVSASEIGGLGLGLYISQKIIEAHGGTIWVDSFNGDGSTFIFEIPIGL